MATVAGSADRRSQEEAADATSAKCRVDEEFRDPADGVRLFHEGAAAGDAAFDLDDPLRDSDALLPELQDFCVEPLRIRFDPVRSEDAKDERLNGAAVLGSRIAKEHSEIVADGAESERQRRYASCGHA
jgi:hypothetical protein